MKILFLNHKYICFRVQAVQNMGLAVVSIITGIIVDKGGYLLLEIFFLGCLCGEWKLNKLFQTCKYLL